MNTARNPFTTEQYNAARPDRCPRRPVMDWFVAAMIALPVIAALVLR